MTTEKWEEEEEEDSKNYRLRLGTKWLPLILRLLNAVSVVMYSYSTISNLSL